MGRYHKPYYLNSKKWRAVRLQCFYRDKYRCTKCGKSGRLEAHHIIPLHKLNEHDGINAYTLKNLMTLCRKCHINLHRSERLQSRANNPYIKLLNSYNDGTNTN